MARRPARKPTTTHDLDARKATILETVVREHIDSAQPVGSWSVAAHSDLAVSSATVRSEMLALEREGYLAQPHTSAGRVPTEKGYRYFVDHLRAGVVGEPTQHQISEFFTGVRGEVEELFARTSSLLSQLTHYTSVVVASAGSRTPIASCQLVSLDARHQLLVTVFTDGTVTKHSVYVTFDVGYGEVAEASRQLNALLLGTRLDERLEVPSRADHVADLVREAVATLHATVPTTEGEQLFIAGSSRVAESFDGVETVRQVLSILEQELLVVSLVQDILERGQSVAIGSESGVAPLASCAIVVAPVTVEGEPVGAVGLLGPTRMKYEEALATARAVSQELTQHLEGHERA